MIWVLLALAIVAATPPLVERYRKPMDDTARGSAPGRLVQLPMGVIHFQWHGPANGPVCICIHGLTTPSFVWGGLNRGLTRMGYRVLTYDLYGRGYSDRPGQPQDRAFFLEQLRALLAHEGVERDITVIGYSMGGAIGTAFAAAHPERVRRLVLLAPAGMGLSRGRMMRFIMETPVIGDWLMLALFPRLHRKNVRAERDLPSAVPHITDLQLAELDYRGFTPAVLASLRGILSDTMEAEHRKLHAAGLPVLAIWGEEDKVIPAECIGTLAAWSRNAEHEVIEGAGHGLTYTHADEILDILKTRL
ncbi:alpha/beta hydrolase [Sulfitobacter alexandrii]|uniref:Alpha/beta hydrolase n=1 Tax=Sulfitobacter alexandrii TaxID=1917485 RepID=A0A1J0WL51_9RHOB|nr:alpha/beta hydrolase [Sulfitobacter alexandrii]APE44902.1 alpha/beta hydrolase [Sulfitobacter alexandrii]